jgi:hypothetical protein
MKLVKVQSRSHRGSDTSCENWCRRSSETQSNSSRSLISLLTRKVGTEVKKTHSSRPPTRAPILGAPNPPHPAPSPAGGVRTPYLVVVVVPLSRPHTESPPPSSLPHCTTACPPPLELETRGEARAGADPRAADRIRARPEVDPSTSSPHTGRWRPVCGVGAVERQQRRAVVWG